MLEVVWNYVVKKEKEQKNPENNKIDHNATICISVWNVNSINTSKRCRQWIIASEARPNYMLSINKMQKNGKG